VTPNRLTAIRARLDGGYAPSSLDAALLLDEVERLRADPLPAAAWVREVERAAFRRGAEAMQDEVERLTTLLAGTEAVLENEREYQTRLKAEVGQLANESFRRGAEAMRTALLQRVSWGSDLADRIRNEPVPEDK
jgi:hypothetical protein